MNPTEFKDALTQRPFRPFNVHFPSGKVYAIRSENQAIISPGLRTITIVRPAVPGKPAGGFDMLDVIMIERLEMLDTPALPPNWWLRDEDVDDSPGGFHSDDAA